MERRQRLHRRQPLTARIFNVGSLIATLSEAMTLEPGDVIATGTPAGVGYARKPPVFMRVGDRIEVEIEGVGSLTNTVARSEVTVR